MSMGVNDGRNSAKSVFPIHGEVVTRGSDKSEVVTRGSDKNKAKVAGHNVEVCSPESEFEHEYEIIEYPGDTLLAGSKGSPSILDRDARNIDEGSKNRGNETDVQVVSGCSSNVTNHSKKEALDKNNAIKPGEQANVANGLEKGSIQRDCGKLDISRAKSDNSDAVFKDDRVKYEAKCEKLKKQIKAEALGSKNHARLEALLLGHSLLLEEENKRLAGVSNPKDEKEVIHENEDMQACDEIEGKTARSELEKVKKQSVLENNGLPGGNPYANLQAELERFKKHEVDNRDDSGKYNKGERRKTTSEITMREEVGGSNKTKDAKGIMQKESKGSTVSNGSADGISQLKKQINDRKLQMERYDSSHPMYKYYQDKLKLLNAQLETSKNSKSGCSAVKAIASNEAEPVKSGGLGKRDFGSNQKMHGNHNNQPSAYYSSESETKTNDFGDYGPEFIPSISRSEVLYNMESIAFGNQMAELVAGNKLTADDAAAQHQKRYCYQQRKKEHGSSGEVVVRKSRSEVMMNSKGTSGRSQNYGNQTPIPKTGHQQHGPQRRDQAINSDKPDFESRKELDSLLADIHMARADKRFSSPLAVKEFFKANAGLVADNASAKPAVPRLEEYGIEPVPAWALETDGDHQVGQPVTMMYFENRQKFKDDQAHIWREIKAKQKGSDK